jgi:hypothetical protein
LNVSVLAVAVVQVGVVDHNKVAVVLVVHGNACLSPCQNLAVLERL